MNNQNNIKVDFDLLMCEFIINFIDRREEGTSSMKLVIFERGILPSSFFFQMFQMIITETKQIKHKIALRIIIIILK